MPTLIGPKRDGQVRARQGSDGIVVYEQDLHYLVQADYAGQPLVEILNNTQDLPRVNVSLVPGGATGSLMCASADAKMKQGNVLLFDVTCTFSSQVQEGVDPDTPQQGDPTVWVPIADVVFEPYTEVVREDINGKAWVNSANKPFEVGLEVPRRLAAATFTQFEPTGTTTVDDIIQDRCDKINSGAYKGYPAKTLLIQVDRATIGFFYGVRCWRVQYTVKYKSETWTIKQLDAGWHYYDGSNNLQPFLDDTGGQFIGLLDGDGGKLANQQTDDPVYEEFEKFEAVNFGDFLRW